jgi:ribonuclease HI
MDGSVTTVSAACGGLFRSHTARFRGCFAQRINENHGFSVIHAEIMALIIAMEIANSKHWNFLCLESDSKVALHAFDNIDIVPWDLRNRWLNCLAFGITLQWSHIYREGNSCADKIANLGHAYNNLEWWESLPSLLRNDFLRDTLGLPQYRSI